MENLSVPVSDDGEQGTNQASLTLDKRGEWASRGILPASSTACFIYMGGGYLARCFSRTEDSLHVQPIQKWLYAR